MRLLFVHDRFGAMAGAEVNIHLAATALKNRGHSLALLHGHPTGRGEAEWRALFDQRFPLVPENRSSTTTTALRAFSPEAVYVHKMSDPDVLKALVESGCPLTRMVHDHDLYCLRSYKYFPLTRRICERAAGPYCVFPCGAVLGRQGGNGWPLRWRSYRAKKRELLWARRFHRLFVASQYMRRELLRNGFDPDRIEIHAPVPPGNGSAPHSTFGPRNRIVFAGQVIRGKGVDLLLAALARVRAPFECVVLGDGNARSRCERLAAKLGLAGKVQFQGYLPPAELPPFYLDASLAVVCSVWPEPFGAVGVEAMRHGLPVVAFDAGGIREWLLDGRNGFLVPWMDRAQLAARIEQLLQDKELARRMGDFGRQFARDRFNFQQYISDLEGGFNRAIAAARARPAP